MVNFVRTFSVIRNIFSLTLFPRQIVGMKVFFEAVCCFGCLARLFSLFHDCTTKQNKSSGVELDSGPKEY